jgi:hypothetical protein
LELKLEFFLVQRQENHLEDGFVCVVGSLAMLRGHAQPVPYVGVMELS